MEIGVCDPFVQLRTAPMLPDGTVAGAARVAMRSHQRNPAEKRSAHQSLPLIQSTATRA